MTAQLRKMEGTQAFLSVLAKKSVAMIVVRSTATSLSLPDHSQRPLDASRHVAIIPRIEGVQRSCRTLMGDPPLPPLQSQKLAQSCCPLGVGAWGAPGMWRTKRSCYQPAEPAYPSFSSVATDNERVLLTPTLFSQLHNPSTQHKFRASLAKDVEISYPFHLNCHVELNRVRGPRLFRDFFPPLSFHLLLSTDSFFVLPVPTLPRGFFIA